MHCVPCFVAGQETSPQTRVLATGDIVLLHSACHQTERVERISIYYINHGELFRRAIRDRLLEDASKQHLKRNFEI